MTTEARPVDDKLNQRVQQLVADLGRLPRAGEFFLFREKTESDLCCLPQNSEYPRHQVQVSQHGANT